MRLSAVAIKKIKWTYLSIVTVLGWLCLYLLFFSYKVDGLQVQILKTSHDVLEQQRLRDGQLPKTMEDSDIRRRVGAHTLLYTKQSPSTYLISIDDGRTSLGINQNGHFSDAHGREGLNHFLLNWFSIGGNFVLLVWVLLLAASPLLVLIKPKRADFGVVTHQLIRDTSSR